MERKNVERVTVWLAYGWLALVGVCVAAMSWKGLVGFAEVQLRMEAPLSWGVPIALDGFAVTLAFLSLRAVLAGDAAALPRILAWVVVGGGAAFNYYHAKETYGEAAAEAFFAGMTILVYLGFEVILRQLRRRSLREAGAVEAPLPRFRLARWLRYPLETFDAWSAAVRYGLTEPGEALRVVNVRRVDEDLEVEGQEERPELEVREKVTTERSITARNGTQKARILELAGQGLDLDGIVERTGFNRDTVRVTLRRIEQRRPGGGP